MDCPKCKAGSEVLRTERGQGGARRRTRQCLAPACQHRFVTTESLRTDGLFVPADQDALIASLQDGRGYDREAVAAALRTDRRRAAISRRQAQERAADQEAGYEDAAPDSLDHLEARRLLRGY